MKSQFSRLDFTEFEGFKRKEEKKKGEEKTNSRASSNTFLEFPFYVKNREDSFLPLGGGLRKHTGGHAVKEKSVFLFSLDTFPRDLFVLVPTGSNLQNEAIEFVSSYTTYVYLHIPV